MIFIHIGLHKTGTTFMQNCVFPHFDIGYLGLSSSKGKSSSFNNRRLIEELFEYDIDNDNVLLSDENLLWQGSLLSSSCRMSKSHNENYLRVLRNIKTIFPHAKMIISFRRHDKYVKSLYKHYIGMGGVTNVNSFYKNLPLNTNSLDYMELIRSIENLFGVPFVYLQEELNNNSDFQDLLDDLSNYMGVEGPDMSSISKQKKNVGLYYYQTQFLRKYNTLFTTKFNQGYTSNKFIYYAIRKLALSLMDKITKNNVFDDKLEKSIMRQYQNDWKSVHEYIYYTRGKRV